MTRKKRRLTVTVDPDLAEAGEAAVAAGRVGSVSEWVNIALADQARRDAQLALLAAAVSDYEREFGEITADEIVAQQRADRERAVIVRGPRPARVS